MALTQTDKNEIIEALKAESTGIDDLTVVTTLDGVNSLPAVRGTDVVSVPMELLRKPAMDAAKSAASAATSATNAEAQATAAAKSAEEAGKKAASAETSVKAMAWPVVNGIRTDAAVSDEISAEQFAQWGAGETWHYAFHRGYNRFVCVLHSSDYNDCEGGDAFAKWPGSDEYNNADGTARADRVFKMSGRLYVVYDGEFVPVGEHDKAWFRGYWNMLCGAILAFQDKSYGGYDYASDTYTLNGLTLTEAEARRIAVYADKSVINSDTANHFSGHGERTVLPILIMAKSGVGRSIKSAFAYDAKKEALTFRHGVNDAHCVSDLRETFAGNTALKSIEGLRLAHGAPTAYAFWHCYALQTLQLYNLDSDLDLGDCSELTMDSVTFILTWSAATATRTLTLHHDVYEQLTQIQIAEALKKNISIAEAAE
nr:MAG TPA: hypothetical protein [Caudoviricetes sp.]